MESPLVEAQERWKVFREKIESRFHETLSQCETLLPNVLELQDFDTTPFAVAWQGIEAQAKQLIDKIEDTWRNKVSVAFEQTRDEQEVIIDEKNGDIGAFHERFYKMYVEERRKGEELSYQLERELKAYGVRTYSSAAKKLQRKASEILGKTFLCTQCKAPLSIKQNFFRSYYQTCEYCQTVNTFEPGTIARNVEHFALHPLAEEKSLTEYFAYRDMEKKFNSQRTDELQTISVQQVLDVYTVYAEKYLKARIEVIPEYEKQFDKDLAAKVERIKKSLTPLEWNAA